MGLRGRPPTPTPILEMRGSWRAKARTGEPRPARGRPQLPRHLTKPQRAVWDSLCKTLDAMGILTTADGWQLERYAVYLGRWRACEAFLARQDEYHLTKGVNVPPGCFPVFSDDSDTYVMPLGGGRKLIGYEAYPAVKHSLQYDQSLKKIEAHFGLTPADRARLAGGADPPKPADPFEDYLRARANKRA